MWTSATLLHLPSEALPVAVESGELPIGLQDPCTRDHVTLCEIIMEVESHLFVEEKDCPRDHAIHFHNDLREVVWFFSSSSGSADPQIENVSGCSLRKGHQGGCALSRNSLIAADVGTGPP